MLNDAPCSSTGNEAVFCKGPTAELLEVSDCVSSDARWLNSGWHYCRRIGQKLHTASLLSNMLHTFFVIIMPLGTNGNDSTCRMLVVSALRGLLTAWNLSDWALMLACLKTALRIRDLAFPVTW